MMIDDEECATVADYYKTRNITDVLCIEHVLNMHYPCIAVYTRLQGVDQQ